MTTRASTGRRSSPKTATQPSFRSGAVARIAQMPVSTLRIWEQRYQAIGPTTAASGQRLYSAADVQRVLLLRRLTEQGHAIGTLAGLDMAQLQQVADARAADAAAPPVQAARRAAALKVAVVGEALALRLQRPAVVQRLRRRWRVTVVYGSLTEAAQAQPGAAVDLLLWQAPGLQPGALPELQAARKAASAARVAVAYGFSAAAARAEFAGTGASLVREPADDAGLGDWLASLEAESQADPRAQKDGRKGARKDAPKYPAVAPDSAEVAQVLSQVLTSGEVPPPRFTDAALTSFAGLSSTIACECPAHVAELLMQLSNFEAYSASCTHRSPADAALHAYLQRVAGVSRALFEAALERVAREEGLRLP